MLMRPPIQAWSEVGDLMGSIFGPGLFQSSPVQVALIVGTVVAVVSGVVGVFTVVRGQSFSGHALADLGTAGGSGAFLLGVSQLWGFVVIAAVAAGTIDLIGPGRARSRDLATGIVLGAGLGLAALFLYLDTTSSNTSGASMTILFGSIFTIDGGLVPIILGLGVVSLGTVLILYRMLLFSSLSSDMAVARAVPVRLVGIGYLVSLALAVSLSAMTIGAVLSTALLIGPAACALRLTKHPGLALLLAALIGVAVTWVSIVLAYDSFYWPPGGRGWPVSFFVVALIFTLYLLLQLPARRWASKWASRSAIIDARPAGP
ncbi:MAG TPA: metal ABC transporter permease [Candidatus Micrarchaeaceae archaeon]|nr:metal ABC transporter permease [Candidatus Micrarchaeaceae archaeon]